MPTDCRNTPVPLRGCPLRIARSGQIPSHAFCRRFMACKSRIPPPDELGPGTGWARGKRRAAAGPFSGLGETLRGGGSSLPRRPALPPVRAASTPLIQRRPNPSRPAPRPAGVRPIRSRGGPWWRPFKAVGRPGRGRIESITGRMRGQGAVLGGICDRHAEVVSGKLVMNIQRGGCLPAA